MQNKDDNNHQIKITIGSQRLARRSSLGVSLIKPFAERSTTFKMPETLGVDILNHADIKAESLKNSVNLS